MVAVDRYIPGQRVKKWAGVQMVGTVIRPIYWKDCDDGTYKAPEPGDVCVKWDDGTKGYCKKVWLKHVSSEGDK